MTHDLRIYTDGGCWNNTGEGAWAFVVTEHGQEIYSNSSRVANTTNNKMELQAMIEAIAWLDRPVNSVVVVSDSQYCINGITQWVHGWIEKHWITYDKKPVKNREQWELLYFLAHKWIHTNIEFKWVKGHSGQKFNEMADQLCTDAIATFKTRPWTEEDLKVNTYPHLFVKPPPIKLMNFGK
jgi:ribonuclease HI